MAGELLIESAANDHAPTPSLFRGPPRRRASTLGRPGGTDVDTFIQQIINGLVLGSVYALVALGYTMVYGIIGLINFAHGDLVMIGALTSLSVLKLLLA